ncbi:alpha/beta hydrolase [Halosimplex pelagicum]|uniref:Dienelactone hydrolase family protein n=1 Tax=Halosimplex pelagicum TaxID=869886 RepID=A0A7D5PGZ1_9EURY|nr:dienelactone hydrolase family protein [Halosimplex pelagicum]QLH84579.1 dienelactone hydrolase family protein [Halosimplex pelagicum]
MATESVTLDVDGDSYPGRVNEPDEPTGAGVLVLPGLNHGPFGDVFDQFAAAAADESHRVARFETWSGPDDLDGKSEAEMERELGAGVAFLRDRDCDPVAVVAKSFGGRLALTHLPTERVDRLVLWAPAVFAGEHEDRPSITADELAAVDVPTRVLQGDDDEGLPVENARTLADHLPAGEAVALPGEDHSFQRERERTVAETLDLLSE